MSKRCSKCGEVKPLDEFFRNRKARDGRHSSCKVCSYATERATRRPKSYPVSVESKHCARCDEVKPAAEFTPLRSALDGLYSYCKACHNAANTAGRRKRGVKPHAPMIERFESYVQVAPGCWEWLAYRDPAGYGFFGTSSRKVEKAHRVAYKLAYGAIPDGYEVHHTCENRGCVRPDHLEALTPLEHRRRHTRIPIGPAISIAASI